MKLLSELLSKKVLNIYQSRIEGVVCNAVYKDKRVAYLQFFDEQEEEYLLDTSKIYSINDEIIVIRNSECIMPATNIQCEGRLLGIDAYNESGQKLGQVEEIMLNDNFALGAIRVDGCDIDASGVLNINEVAIVRDNKNITLSNFKPKEKKILKSKYPHQKVMIMPLDNEVGLVQQEDGKTLVEKLFPQSHHNDGGYMISSSPAPQKVIGIGSGKYLIGRKATKTIYGVNNEILIKKDTFVTGDILSKVRSHNKLMELALYTKEKSKQI